MENYRIGVGIYLTNRVSGALGMIAGHFAKTEKEAAKLRKTLQEIKLLGLSGLLIGGAGFAGLYAMSKMVNHAKEYAHQLNIMKMAGLSNLEMAEATAAAWKNTKDVVISTATGNLSILMDMRNVLSGGMKEALPMLPIVSKIAAVMAASGETKISSNAQGIAFDVTKAMDIMGLNTFAQMQHGAEMMTKVVTAFQNRISPSAIGQTLYYARQARYSPDDSFTYGVVPTMMLERVGGGGASGSKGIGPQLAAVNRVAVMGIMNKKTQAWFHDLGLLHGKSVRTTTTGTITAGLDHKQAWQNNQFFATWRDLVPAMGKKFGEAILKDPAKLRMAITGSSMQQTAMSQLMEYVTKPGNFLRDMSNVGVMPALKDLPPLLQAIAQKMGLRSGGGAMGYEQAYKMALSNDPQTQLLGLQSQWNNLLTDMGFHLMPTLLPMLKDFVSWLSDLVQWMRQHPSIAKALMWSFFGLSASMMFGGVVMGLTAAFKALSLVLIGNAGGGIVAATWAARGGLLGLLAPLAAVAAIVAVFQPGRIGYDPKDPKNMKEQLDIRGGDPQGHPKGPLWYFFHDMFYGKGVGSPATNTPGWTTNTGKYFNQSSQTQSPDALADAIKKALNGMTVTMDGRKVGSVVAGGMAKNGGSVSFAPSGFNPALSPVLP